MLGKIADIFYIVFDFMFAVLAWIYFAISDLQEEVEPVKHIKDHPQKDESIDYYLTVNEAGIVLGVHPETVKKYCISGKLPATKFHYTWLIKPSDLERFASQRRGVK